MVRSTRRGRLTRIWAGIKSTSNLTMAPKLILSGGRPSSRISFRRDSANFHCPPRPHAWMAELYDIAFGCRHDQFAGQDNVRQAGSHRTIERQTVDQTMTKAAQPQTAPPLIRQRISVWTQPKATHQRAVRRSLPTTDTDILTARKGAPPTSPHNQSRKLHAHFKCAMNAKIRRTFTPFPALLISRRRATAFFHSPPLPSALMVALKLTVSASRGSPPLSARPARS